MEGLRVSLTAYLNFTFSTRLMTFALTSMSTREYFYARFFANNFVNVRRTRYVINVWTYGSLLANTNQTRVAFFITELWTQVGIYFQRTVFSVLCTSLRTLVLKNEKIEST